MRFKVGDLVVTRANPHGSVYVVSGVRIAHSGREVLTVAGGTIWHYVEIFLPVEQASGKIITKHKLGVPKGVLP